MEFVCDKPLQNPHETGKIIVVEGFAPGEVHVHFVNRGPLNNRCDLIHSCSQFFRDFPILVMPGPDYYQMGAETQCPCCRHCGPHTKRPGLIGCGRHNAPASGGATHGHRLSDERGILEAFDRDKEAIEIKMRDLFR